MWENPEGTCADKGRTCKLGTERPQSWGSDPWPSCCEATVQITTPPSLPFSFFFDFKVASIYPEKIFSDFEHMEDSRHVTTDFSNASEQSPRLLSDGHASMTAERVMENWI